MPSLTHLRIRPTVNDHIATYQTIASFLDGNGTVSDGGATSNSDQKIPLPLQSIQVDRPNPVGHNRYKHINVCPVIPTIRWHLPPSVNHLELTQLPHLISPSSSLVPVPGQEQQQRHIIKDVNVTTCSIISLHHLLSSDTVPVTNLTLGYLECYNGAGRTPYEPLIVPLPSTHIPSQHLQSLRCEACTPYAIIPLISRCPALTSLHLDLYDITLPWYV
jgi:hypothetical protein